MSSPKVSVIIPVYNAENYLRDALDCIADQTLKDIEIICVDDASTDSSYDILQEYAEKDSRFIVFRQEKANAGAARNNGFARASGEYAYFFDSDDLCAKNLLELAVKKADETGADFVAFDFYRFTDPEKKTRVCGVHTDWLKEYKETFNYSDMPKRILSSMYLASWNKVYRTSFIKANDLIWEKIPSVNDLTFVAVGIVKAEKIAVIHEPLISRRISENETNVYSKGRNVSDICYAVMAVTYQIEQLSYYELIRSSLWRFEIENLYEAVCGNKADFGDEETRKAYEKIYEYFNSEHFSGMLNDGVGNPKYYQSFEIIRKHNLTEIIELKKAKIIVSITSYPARIGYVAAALESIWRQTKTPDKVVLYLAEKQFPDHGKNLTSELNELEKQGKLRICYVSEDLKPHKKYFYALKEYPDDLIVTIDDDLQYSQDMIACLYESYLQYPRAVSALRTHLIVFNNEGKVAPYKEWIKETDGCIYRPSMQLLCTGGAGALYPPHIFDETVCNIKAIESTCLEADDLWLKANELVCSIPVVLARKTDPLIIIQDSQENALCYSNVIEGKNDAQWQKISDFMDQKYGAGILVKQLMKEGYGERIIGAEALYRHMREIVVYPKNTVDFLQKRLNTAYAQKSEINAKLQQTYREKSEINANLKSARQQLNDTRRQLKDTQQELKDARRQLQNTQRQLDDLHEKLRHPVKTAAKKVVKKLKKK